MSSGAALLLVAVAGAAAPAPALAQEEAPPPAPAAGGGTAGRRPAGRARAAAAEDLSAFDRANRLYLEGRYAEAAAELAQFEARFPASAYLDDALYFRAKCLLEIDRPVEARDLLRRIYLEEARTNYADDALWEAARLEADRFRSDATAADLLDRLLERYPESPWAGQAMLRLGEIRERQRRPEEAERLYGDAERSDSYSARTARERLGRGYGYDGQPGAGGEQGGAAPAPAEPQAQPGATPAPQARPSDSAAPGRPPAAGGATGTGSSGGRPSPDPADAVYREGERRLAAGDPAAAEECFRRVLDEHPQSPRAAEAIWQVYECLRAQRRLADADRFIEDALRTHPAAREAQRARGGAPSGSPR